MHSHISRESLLAERLNFVTWFKVRFIVRSRLPLADDYCWSDCFFSLFLYLDLKPLVNGLFCYYALSNIAVYEKFNHLKVSEKQTPKRHDKSQRYFQNQAQNKNKPEHR